MFIFCWYRIVSTDILINIDIKNLKSCISANRDDDKASVCMHKIVLVCECKQIYFGQSKQTTMGFQANSLQIICPIPPHQNLIWLSTNPLIIYFFQKKRGGGERKRWQGCIEGACMCLSLNRCDGEKMWCLWHFKEK